MTNLRITPNSLNKIIYAARLGAVSRETINDYLQLQLQALFDGGSKNFINLHLSIRGS